MMPETQKETPQKITSFLKRLTLFNVGFFLALLFISAILNHFAMYDLSGILSYLFWIPVIGVLLQLVVSIVALFKKGARRGGVACVAFSLLEIYGFITLLAIAFSGAGWGRPLRIKGKQIHPELCEGKGWAKGDKPNISGLDVDTCRALEALWLHDAQKEHASVPAFSRISWLLAAVGAPAALMEWAQKAGMEEIDHTRLCLALAAGYGGRTHTVMPMPQLLTNGMDIEGGSAMVTLATESLKDGCQLEDFNADVAGECAKVCEEPVTRAVLEQIAREERSHANFSWALLVWTLEREPSKVKKAIMQALEELENYKRPTAVSWEKKDLVERANPELMLKHGRISDEEWQKLWDSRLMQTRQRLQEMLAEKKVA